MQYETEHRQPKHKVKPSSLFLGKMIAKLERTPLTTQQNKDPTRNPTTTMNKL